MVPILRFHDIALRKRLSFIYDSNDLQNRSKTVTENSCKD